MSKLSHRPIPHNASERPPEVCARYSNCTRRRHFPDCLARFTRVIYELQRLFGGDVYSLFTTAARQLNYHRPGRHSQHIQNP